MSVKRVLVFLAFLSLLLLNRCSKDDAGPSYTISGKITYDYVPITSTGLNYSGIVKKPARRIVVKAVSGNDVLASTVTNDNGEYSLNVSGSAAIILATARSAVSGYTKDGIGSDNCNGASWDIAVRDSNGAEYALSDNVAYDTDTTLNYYAPVTYSGGYTKRSGAPFAILDNMLNGLELICSVNPSQYFPALNVYWSDTYSSSTIPGGTSNYNPNNTAIYILGKENVDTDEFDVSVVAHEFSHYLEDKLFRSDSIGGTHYPEDDFLDIRVAFGEGFGDAMGGIIPNVSTYYDSNGSGQSSIAVTMDLTTPSNNRNGIYVEKDIAYFLYTLYKNRGSFDRIYNTLSNCQKNTDFVTSILTFAVCYRDAYGYVDGVDTMWQSDLLNPALNTVNDQEDSTNAIGNDYDNTTGSNPRTYGSGASDAVFWDVYKAFTSGTAISDTLDGVGPNTGSHASEPSNKFGAIKFYKITGTGSTINLSVTLNTCTGGIKPFEIYVLQKGKSVAYDSANGSGDNTATVSFSSQAGAVYLLELRGKTNNCSQWTITQS
ncbi:MAG: hypothetical protein D6767_00065 [Candidatus Hydrogenedentota bacterium]|nr:MAG: hypothetical protein D6767_00065 [Candidatus Hydrogenedentota bacterium]